MRTTIFFLHFAGGNCFSYQFLYPFLIEYNIVPLELPGRGRRVKENLLFDFNAALQDVFQQIKKYGVTDFIIFGHSLGAYLAFGVSQLLQNSDIRPRFVVVSGNPGPGIGSKKTRHLMNDQDFVAELKELGGMPSELLDNQELLDFVLPIIRADFTLAENNSLTLATKLNCPIFAMMGNEEEHASDIRNWNNLTHSAFHYKIFDGGHFFLHAHPYKIAEFIKEADDRSLLC